MHDCPPLLPSCRHRIQPPPRTLFGRHDRSTVLETDFSHVPGAAGRAAAQRIDGDLELIAGLDARARPSLPDQKAWGSAFEIPDRTAAVLSLDIQEDGDVRARV